MTPAPGDYFVVATTGFVAGCVREFTHSWANHAGIVIGDGMVIEAQPGGVAVDRLAKYEGDHIAFSAKALSRGERTGIVAAATECIGIPYSFLDIAANALSVEPLSGPLGAAVEHRLNRGDRLICSQLVARAYRLGAQIRLVDKPDNYVRPSDLADLLTRKVRLL